MRKQTHPDNTRMEAIAEGVRARLEERTGYSRRITDETASIARTLGVTDKEISRWLNLRQSQLAAEESRLKGIKSILSKVSAR